jgi:hypothetical protein
MGYRHTAPSILKINNKSILIGGPQATVPLTSGKLSLVITGYEARFARELVWNFYEEKNHSS